MAQVTRQTYFREQKVTQKLKPPVIPDIKKYALSDPKDLWMNLYDHEFYEPKKPSHYEETEKGHKYTILHITLTLTDRK